jgi:hypothetical protein
MTPVRRPRLTRGDLARVRLADSIARRPEPIQPCAKPGPAAVRRAETGALPAGLSPMLGIDDLAELLSCSRRLVERMRSTGKVPKPDFKVGKMPRWHVETIRAWIGRGGKP